jgi:hypothetical protein
MKKSLIFVLIICLFGCSRDEDSNKMTIYQGVVVFKDDFSPVTEGTLQFRGMKQVPGIGKLDEIIIERVIELAENGTFQFELEITKSKIDYFAVRLYFGGSPISIDCAPNSCASMPTRTILNDLRFFAERE